MSLQGEYVGLCRSIDSQILPEERNMLNAAGTTLFDIEPHMRLDELTGAYLLLVLKEDLLRRGADCATPLCQLYDKVCAHYAIPCDPGELRAQVKPIAAGQAPSPEAGESPSVAGLSEQRGIMRAS